MKILCLTSTLDSQSGGWGRYSFKILSEYKKKNIDFVVCTEIRTGQFQEERALLLPLSPINLLKNIIIVRKIARDCDVVHAFEGWPLAFYAFLAVIGTSKKMFISGHGTYTVTPLNKLFFGRVLRLAYKRAQKIFCNSKYTATQIIQRIHDAKVKVVPLGSNILGEPTKESMTRVTQTIGGRSPIIISVGALKKRKGQLYTLQAINFLKNKFPNIVYVIIGDDSDTYYKSQLLDYAKKHSLENNLIFKGEVNDDELAAWYQQSSCLALNSVNHDGHFEGFGLVIVESAQFGLPSVGSRDCGIEDAIIDGVTGYLTTQKDQVDIARGISSAILIDNKDEIIKHSRSFNWAVTAQTYLDNYEHEV